MEYIYALKVNEEKENFFAFYSSLNKAKSAGKEWLKKNNKIWENRILCEGIKFYELVLNIYKIQLETTGNYDMRYVTCIFTRRSSGPNGSNIITEEQPSWT